MTKLLDEIKSCKREISFRNLKEMIEQIEGYCNLTSFEPTTAKRIHIETLAEIFFEDSIYNLYSDVDLKKHCSSLEEGLLEFVEDLAYRCGFVNEYIAMDYYDVEIDDSCGEKIFTINIFNLNLS